MQVLALISRISGRPLTSTETLVAGILLVLFGAAHAYAVLFHWEWMQKRWDKWLRWRLAPWSPGGFPATKVGVCFGALSVILVGSMCIADSIKWFPFGDRDYMLIGLILWSAVGVCVVLRDYFIHLNKKDD